MGKNATKAGAARVRIGNEEAVGLAGACDQPDILFYKPSSTPNTVIHNSPLRQSLVVW
jgi:hypothetical protein